MATTTYEKLTYDGKKIQVDSAIRDGAGAKIDTTYATKTELETQNTNLTTEIGKKVTANTAITGATKCKITYDSKGLVTAGANLSASDIPALETSKITGLDTALASKVTANTAITAGTGVKISYDSKGLVTDSGSLEASDIPDISATYATQTNLATKVTANEAITGGTACKITYDTKGLVTKGESLSASDIPSGIAQSKITDLTTDLGNKVTKNANITAGTATKITYDAKGLVTGGANLATTDIPDLSGTYVTQSEFYKTGTLSSTNPVALKDFVNSSVATNTANYISNDGEPFTSVAQLEAYTGTVTNNDYAFVTGTDTAGNTYFDRYKATVSGTTVTWAKEYRLNNSTFTADQWTAINSGISASLITTYNNHVNNSTIHVTASDKTTWNGKQDALQYDTVPTASSSKMLTSGAIKTALDGKVSTNTAITGATKCKITYDSKGLVTGGADLSASDIPTLATSKISGLDTALAGKVTANTDITANTSAFYAVKYDKKGLVTAGRAITSSDLPDLSSIYATVAVANGKVTANTAITGATKCKITYDSKGLVTAGADLSASDIPTLDQSKITNLTTDLAGKQKAFTTTTVTLATSDWSNNSCTKTVSGMTASALVFVAPDPTSLINASTAQVYCSAQASNSLTFTCVTTPTANLTINIAYAT